MRWFGSGSATAPVARRAAAAALVLTALGGCELILAEPPPARGQACPAWRGGCMAAVDFAEDGGTQTLRSEVEAAGSIARADAMRVPRCEAAPFICQVEIGLDVLDERYLGGGAVR